MITSATRVYIGIRLIGLSLWLKLTLRVPYNSVSFLRLLNVVFHAICPEAESQIPDPCRAALYYIILYAFASQGASSNDPGRLHTAFSTRGMFMIHILLGTLHICYVRGLGSTTLDLVITMAVSNR